MLFVIGAFTERRVVEGDEPLVDDGCFAVITPRCEVLKKKKPIHQLPMQMTTEEKGENLTS